MCMGGGREQGCNNVMRVLFLIPAGLGEKSGERGEVKRCNSVVRVEPDVWRRESRVATM